MLERIENGVYPACVFALKAFANMVIFRLLFLAARLRSVKMTSKKIKNSNVFLLAVALWELVAI